MDIATNKSKIMQDDYRPYYEIDFDFKTSITKDQAVLAMLGWRFKPFYEVSEKEFERRFRVHRGGIDVLDFDEPSLLEILHEIKSEADSAYVDAKHDNPEDKDIITQKLEEIKNSHALIETAYRFYCHIEDELTKGEDSKLHIDQYATKKVEEPYITIRSLAKWSEEEYKIELFPTEITTFIDLNRSQEEIQDSLQNELDPGEAEQFHITHALLVEAFANKVPGCINENKEVNVSQLIKTLNENTNMDAYLGQGKSTLSGLYPKILKIKNRTYQKKLESLSKTALKNQRINLAFIVEELCKIDNTEVDDAVSKIVDLSKDLPGQTQNLIDSRIKVAMDVKNDPNSIKP